MISDDMKGCEMARVDCGVCKGPPTGGWIGNRPYVF